MAKRLEVFSSPYMRTKQTTRKMMWDVVIALLPAALAGIYFMGVANTLPVILLTVGAAVVTEAVWQLIFHKPITILDGSAVVTGLILALSLPPAVPWWIAVAAGLTAILVFKHIFGGLGINMFNPAMAARVVIVSQFIRIMVPWTEKGISGVTSASPLMQSLDKISASAYWNLFLGNRTGSIGETSVIALLLGAAYLFYRRTINGWIPAVYLLSVIATSLLLGRDPLFDLMSGAVIMTAFFVATDPVTSPATKWGRIIFATGIGVVTVGIRFTNLFATGEALGIVMMNLTVPFLDKIFSPRVYGTKRKLQINLD